MQKAYDIIEWNFLKVVLHNMGFPPIGSIGWCNVSPQCPIVFLINDSPSEIIAPSRGLRLGDPLSPYLFIMCANVLSCALIRKEHNNNIKRIRIGQNCLTFTHLFFVDLSPFFKGRI